MKYALNDSWYVCGEKDPLQDRRIDTFQRTHIELQELQSPPLVNIQRKNTAITLNTYAHLALKDEQKLANNIME